MPKHKRHEPMTDARMDSRKEAVSDQMVTTKELCETAWKFMQEVIAIGHGVESTEEKAKAATDLSAKLEAMPLKELAQMEQALDVMHDVVCGLHSAILVYGASAVAKEFKGKAAKASEN